MSGLENADALAAIDTATNKVIANMPIGRPPGDRLRPERRARIRTIARTCRRSASPARSRISPRAEGAGQGRTRRPTSVSLFDQGLIQVLQASVTGLEPKQKYVLALSEQADGGGTLQPLAAFMTNAAGSAIVNAAGPIRQIVDQVAAAGQAISRHRARRSDERRGDPDRSR